MEATVALCNPELLLHMLERREMGWGEREQQSQLLPAGSSSKCLHWLTLGWTEAGIQEFNPVLWGCRECRCLITCALTYTALAGCRTQEAEAGIELRDSDVACAFLTRICTTRSIGIPCHEFLEAILWSSHTEVGDKFEHTHSEDALKTVFESEEPSILCLQIVWETN